MCANVAHTASDGKKYDTKFYNLDAIISVEYRVNSQQATHFRIWATNVLKEYVIKGFAMDDERLKNPNFIWIFLLNFFTINFITKKPRPWVFSKSRNSHLASSTSKCNT